MRIFLMVLLFLCLNRAVAQQTVFEKSGGTQTATYFETISFYKDLEKGSKILSVKSMGPTDAGYPLHLVLMSSEGQFDPATWRKQNKVIFFVLNGIHPGEPDGVDASQMLARDIARGKIKLPVNIALAIIPVYNIGGALNRNNHSRVNQNGPVEYGFRGNAQNLDLNRDFTKSDSYNARSFAQIFHYLQPDVFLDTHVSDGADYQHTMTLISTQYEKLGPILGPYLKKELEPAIYRSMAAKNWELIPYVEFDGADLKRGINMFYETPRYSSGYAALFNTIGFIAETHMLKPYQPRVQSTYDLIVSIMQESSGRASEIKSLRKRAIRETIEGKEFPLAWKIDTSQFSTITFKGYEQHTAISEATGLPQMFYNRDKKFVQSLKFFNYFRPQKVVASPTAYIIPQGWHAVLDLLKLNGVKIDRLRRDTQILVNYYRIEDYKTMPRPYEKHHKNSAVSVSVNKDRIKFLKGDAIIYLNQPQNRFIVEMLEPEGDDSYFAWNFFDGILQQKEWFSDYRFDPVAAGLLKKDSGLQRKLAERKAADTSFANNRRAVLGFIYTNSSYQEKSFMRYPVYRLEE